MAENTDLSLRNSIMYMVFVRNYSKEGTFRKVQEDLDRIQELGVDYIWFLPIQPTGKKNRKGSLGSPYALRDYRAVDPAYGSLKDLSDLTDAIHARGMKCILDIVYNHTSPDSVLLAEHPDWFWHRPDGRVGNRIGDWSDVIDLDYSNRKLWEYQIDTLKQWAKYFDGFRCDVAPIVPLAFWLQARQEVEKVHPGTIWIAESVEPEFIRMCRAQGIPMASDSELYQAFDVCYDYDIYADMKKVMTGRAPLSTYLAAMDHQESTYPENYIKLRALENHDRNRAAALIADERALHSWTAFLYFAKGVTLLYAGQEIGAAHHPSIFDKDTVDWSRGTADLRAELQKLAALKQHPIFREGAFSVHTPDENTIVAKYDWNPVSEADHATQNEAVGIFPVKGTGTVAVNLPDGTYTNAYDDFAVDVYEGVLQTNGRPVIIFR